MSHGFGSKHHPIPSANPKIMRVSKANDVLVLYFLSLIVLLIYFLNLFVIASSLVLYVMLYNIDYVSFKNARRLRLVAIFRLY